MSTRRVVQYKVDLEARTVTVDGRTVYAIVARQPEGWDVLREGKKVGSFEVDARDDGKYDAYVSAEEGEDSDLVRSVVRAARRGKLAP
jgi:hypothetical protein